MRITLAGIGDAVITADADDRVTFMNAVAQELAGWPSTKPLDAPWRTCFVSCRRTQTVDNPAIAALARGRVKTAAIIIS
jgi:PAS domain-containing protein